jgi:ribonuclease D
MHYKGAEVLLDSAIHGDVTWVDDDQALARAVAQWPDHIALDTEFIRTNTYFPMPGLYQVAAGSSVYLIDPVEISQWQPFVDYLIDAHTTKIMHACLEDLELLHHHLGITPRSVFDTQYANAFLSEDFSLSYAALVERRLGVALEKHETRSNWLQRPLSNEQIRYAVEDVTFLLPLYEQMQAALHGHGRHHWFESDMQQRSDYAPQDPHVYYRNVKKAWKLKGPQLGALQALCAWRERTAQLENVPRNRVIWDEHLYNFASITELKAGHVRRAVPKGVARRYGDALVDHHREGRESQVPQALPRPLSSQQGAVLKALREVAVRQATSLGIAVELLARKKDLEGCVRHHAENAQLSPQYGDWRAELLAEPFMEILARNQRV